MKSPFIFGKVVTGSSFINRTSEIARLTGNFQNHVNTILISPRRWGKSSLVKKTAFQIGEEKTDLLFCFIDLFRIRTEDEFYRQFASAVIKSTSGKLDEWIKTVKEFMGKLSPSISFGTDPINDFQISFGLANGVLDKEEILNLPEKIASKKKKHIVVCLDEFQNIGNYPDNVDFQKLLRSVWQHHQNVSYCIYGSQRHMMMELFEKQSMPFYKFGDLMLLQKIEKQHFVNFIGHSFTQTGKSIQPELCEKIVDRVEAHPYFVQQLAHVVWVNTTLDATEELLEYSVKELLDQNNILYQEIVNTLSNTQLSFLIALSRGTVNFNSKQALQNNDLGTSGNVTKIKKTLINKEIIDFSSGKIIFLDPVFRLWLLTSFRF
jgi:AAA+ ATPase superfamily predicted ATPase